MASKGRRSQVEAERTRTRILDVAERQFARSGYGGVSLRAVAADAGVRPFTIQHHFGPKASLYQAVLCRFDEALMKRLGERAGDATGASDLIDGLLDEVFDFFLERRDWVALNARASLGEGLPPGVTRMDRGWLRFVEGEVEGRAIAAEGLDLRLLLMTVEGVLNQHVLGDYRAMFGCGLDDPALRATAKAHLRRVVRALLGAAGGEGRVAP